MDRKLTVKRYLAAIFFAVVCAWSFASAQMLSPIVNFGKPRVGSESYSNLGGVQNIGVSSGESVTLPLTMPGAGGLLVVGIAIQNSPTLSSVVFDPTGQNVTLNQDNLSGTSLWLYSGPVTSVSGSKNVVITATSSIGFDTAEATAWLIQNPHSNTVKQISTFMSYYASINVTAGDYLFALGGNGTPGWSSSTQTPSNTYTYDDYLNAADWIVTSTNSSFTVQSDPHNLGTIATSYH